MGRMKICLLIALACLVLGVLEVSAQESCHHPYMDSSLEISKTRDAILNTQPEEVQDSLCQSMLPPAERPLGQPGPGVPESVITQRACDSIFPWADEASCIREIENARQSIDASIARIQQSYLQPVLEVRQSSLTPELSAALTSLRQQPQGSGENPQLPAQQDPLFTFELLTGNLAIPGKIETWGGGEVSLGEINVYRVGSGAGALLCFQNKKCSSVSKAVLDSLRPWASKAIKFVP